MKRKYFLFRKEDLSLLSSSSSEEGDGLSVFGVSADSMSYITAIKGGVVMYFNNATPYEDNQLTDGESFEKTKVVVNCEDGKEVDLIESVMNFLSSDQSPAIMRFDSVDQSSSLKEVRTSVSVGATIKTHPINRVTKEPSFQLDNAFTASTGAVINDIDFISAALRPDIDYEFEEGTYNASSPFELTALANSGTAGATYDIDLASSVGNITKVDAGSTSGFTKVSGGFTLSTYLKLTNTYENSESYTLYAVFNPAVNPTNPVGPLYGSDSGETTGFSVVDTKLPNQSKSAESTIGVRHEDKLSTPAISRTDVYDQGISDGTTNYVFPVKDTDDPDYQQCYVLIIRRDDNGNIIVNNHTGDRIAFIEGTDPSRVASSLGTLPGDTSGVLTIDQIGSSGGNITSSFKGHLARFGVIKKDVGEEIARNLAKQMFNLYKF